MTTRRYFVSYSLANPHCYGRAVLIITGAGEFILKDIQNSLVKGMKTTHDNLVILYFKELKKYER